MASKVKTGIVSAVAGATILGSTIILPSIKLDGQSKRLNAIQYRNLKTRLIKQYEKKGELPYDDKVMLVNIMNYELQKRGKKIKKDLKNLKKGESKVIRNLINHIK